MASHDHEKRQPPAADLQSLQKLAAVGGEFKAIADDMPVLQPENNATVLAVCHKLDAKRSKESTLAYFGSDEYSSSIKHYMSSSEQAPECVFRPMTARDIQIAMSLIHQHCIEFAIASGKHSGNVGFSSTRGLHIDLRELNHIKLSNDKESIHLGTGNTWDDVYKYLEGTGRAVQGGRVSGIGVGGFLTGGGGYSFLTSRYGMTTDSIISVDMILPDGTPAHASKDSNPDLFFAIKGGGNQFGVVYNFCLKTYPQTEKIWGGLRVFAGSGIEKTKKAIYDFQMNNTDDKAQLIPSFSNVGGANLLGLTASYDGLEPPKDVFGAFDSLESVTGEWGPISVPELVQSAGDNLTAGIRATFHTVSAHYFPLSVFDFVVEEGERLHSMGSKLEGGNGPRSGLFFGLTPDSVINNYGKHTSASANAWSYEKSPQPMSLYYGWADPADDDFYYEEIKKSANKVQQLLIASGQQIDDLPLYPNYARSDTPAEQLYEPENLERLRRIKRQVDPQNTMRLAGYYRF